MELSDPVGPSVTPNREKGFPIIGAFYIPIADRLKCDKNEEFLFAIRGIQEGRPDWRRDVRDFLKISRLALIANKDTALSAPFTAGPPID